MAELNQSFKLDEDGRLAIQVDGFGNKSFQITTGVDTIEQNLRIRLESVIGEDFLHPEIGLDFAAITRVSNTAFLEDRVRDTLALDPDLDRITRIESIEADRTRLAQIQVSAVAKTGESLFTQAEV